jgi:dipeptidyl aminopeptidase/acylaminoacyl peptidase
MDDTPDDLPERYAEASPAERLPLGTPQLFLHGRQDYVIPWQQISAYAEVATSAGDEVRVHFFEEASHFEVIAPNSEAWSQEIGPALMDWLMALPAVESRD